MQPSVGSADHHLFAGDDVALTKVEKWVLDRARRYGITGFVARASFVAVAASTLIVLAALYPLGAFEDTADWIPALSMGAAVPAVVAPPMLGFCSRLIARFDTTVHLLHLSAVTDPLTGVLNRRGFFDVLGQMCEGGDEFEVAMIDLDAFKALNDTHGHAAGDRALQHVAGWLREVVGDGGHVGRLGGDEFAWVAGLDPEREAPARAPFVVDGIEFTASIGRAVAAPGQDPDATLLAADSGLYATKRLRSGRRDVTLRPT